MSRFHTLRVSRVEPLCEDAAAVTFEVPPELASAYSFAPGQSVVLRRTVDGVEQRRNYSICSDRELRVGVREVPDGLFSTWLVRDLAPGDEVEVQPPAGRFALPEDATGHHVLIGAGSGITPLLALAHALLARPDARVTLLYGNRTTTSVMFAEELADLKDAHPDRFQLVHVLSREPREVELFSGRLDAERTRAILTALVPVPEVAGFWLCGPFEMITGLRELLTGLGVGPERVHLELFFVDDVPPPPVRHPDAAYDGPTTRVRLTLDGRTSDLELPRDQPVLDAAQRHRGDLPFACKGGVCGTCRAQVTAGEVDLRRNFALEQHELDEGFVLTCQSWPVSDELELTYDA